MEQISIQQAAETVNIPAYRYGRFEHLVEPALLSFALSYFCVISEILYERVADTY